MSKIETRPGSLPILAQGQPMLGDGLWMRFFGPESRGWLRTCQEWVQGGASPLSQQSTRELLGALSQHDRTLATLIFECAATLVQAGGIEPIPKTLITNLANKAVVAPGLVRDFLFELASPAAAKTANRTGLPSGSPRPSDRSQTVAALLIDERGSEETGIVADLRLELVAGGTGCVYPTPALAFLRWDREFEQAAEIALERAKQAGVWPENSDLRWSMSRRDGQSLGTLLLGNSLGGAFAFGLERLMANGSGPSDSLGKPTLSGVAVSATIRLDGSLGSVGDILLKLVAAAHERAFPRLHTIVISAEEELNIPGLEQQADGSNVFCDPMEDFHVLKARNLASALELLRDDQQERWHGIDCQLPPPDPDFTGREAVFELVKRFIEENDNGYLILRGEMGIGKSAFLAALLHAERAKGSHPVYHLISSNHSGQPDQIAACLYDRLRRKHRVLEPSEWARFKVEVKLERLMLRLSEKLQAENRKEVIYLEAADQAQLAPGQFLIPDYLGHLPQHFFCVVTSRFKTNWNKLQGQIKVCNLSEVIDAAADLREYLRKKSAQVSPPLEEDFIERMAGQFPTPVFFTVVACLNRLKDPATPEEDRRLLLSNPAHWAMPPKELIARELRDRLGRARQDGIPEEEFWLALGLLTVTGEDQLGMAQLEQLGVLSPERKAVLESCASFFLCRPTLEEPACAYVFAHPGYIREIQERAGLARLRKCHELLAIGSAAVLARREEIARVYALRHLPAHLRHAHDYDKLCCVLTDLAFLVEALGVDSCCGLRPGDHSALPALSPFRLTHEFRKACEAVTESHPKYTELKALGGVVDKHSHLLQDDPSLLPQLLNNELIWQLGAHTPLGQQIRTVAEKQSRPWLKSVSSPANKGSQEPVRVLSGHQKGVLSVAFSPDGQLLVSGGADKTIILWRALSGESCCLTSHHGPVNAMAFSPSGQHFVSGTSDGSLIIWECTGRQVRRLSSGSGPVLALAFTPDASRLISAGADGALSFWDAHTWQLLQKAHGHGAAVRSVATSPDSKLVVSGGEDKTIRVWNAADGSWLTTIREPDRWIEAVAFLHDSQTIVSGGGFRCGDVKFWDLEGRCIRIWPNGHNEGIKALAVSQDGLKLASGSYDGKVLVRNIRTAARYLPMGHTDRIEALAFSHDGKTLATASADRKIRIWDVSGQPAVTAHQDDHTIETPEPMLRDVICMQDGSLAVTCAKTSVLKLIETASGTTRSVMHGQPDRDLSCIAASADHHFVVAGSFQQVRLWRLNTASSLRTLYGHSGWVLAASFSPDAKRIAAGGEDDNLIVWDTESGTWLRTFHCQQKLIRDVSCTPDGRWFTTGGEDGTLKFWDHEGKESPRIFQLHKAAVVAVAFAPHTHLVATGSEDESLRLFDYESRIVYPPMRQHRGAVTALAFSQNGRWLASGSSDGTVRIWHVQDSRLLAWMPCSDRVLAVRFEQQDTVIQIADAGGASHRPNFLRMELANFPAPELASP